MIAVKRSNAAYSLKLFMTNWRNLYKFYNDEMTEIPTVLNSLMFYK